MNIENSMCQNLSPTVKVPKPICQTLGLRKSIGREIDTRVFEGEFGGRME